MNESILIQVSLDANDDSEYVAGLARQLSRDLLELEDVRSVEPGPAALPPGAMGLGIALSAILGSIAQVGNFTALASVLTAWVSADRSRKIKLTVNNNTIELNSVSAAQQQDLIDWFKTQAGKPA